MRTTVDYADHQQKGPRFFSTVRAGNTEQVNLLLGDTPELARERGPTGETPLHYAAAGGFEAIADALLSDDPNRLKADVNAQDTNRFGGTPLHWAVQRRHLAMARHLIAKGADP